MLTKETKKRSLTDIKNKLDRLSFQMSLLEAELLLLKYRKQIGNVNKVILVDKNKTIYIHKNYERNCCQKN